MKDRPMLFSGPMVCALLAGRKAQTRRVVKPGSGPHSIETVVSTPDSMAAFIRHRCPYGRPGDRLWVRETCRAEELPSGLDGVRYLADDEFIPIENSERASEKWVALASYGMKKSGRVECRKVPSIHMPRWASRILLEITGVRVERLKDISEADAIAEGAPRITPDQKFMPAQALEWYRLLWDQINGPGSWTANPWVWVVEFRRVAP